MHSPQVTISLTNVGSQHHPVRQPSDLKLHANHLSLSSPANNKSVLVGVVQASFNKKMEYKILPFGIWHSVLWNETAMCQHTGRKILPPSLV